MTMPAAPFPRCDETAAWAALQRHFQGAGKSFDVRTAMDAQRVAAFSLQAPHVFADLSKNLVDGPAHDLLLQLARDCALEAQRDAMFRGERINATETAR
jgi:glucose-6-phosphate isomerase